MNTATLPVLMVSPARDRAEWDHAWAALVAHWKGDCADYNRQFGECWQYMGTELRGDCWEHVFRHRMHPRTNRREYFRALATDAFHASNPAPAPTSEPDYIGRSAKIIPFNPHLCSGAFDGVRVLSDAEGDL